MANFEIAYRITMKVEAGYANDPTDTGGETFAGVSRNANPKWTGWPVIDAIKRVTDRKNYDKAMFADADLMGMVRRLYKQNYWDVNRLDEVKDQAIADELFDTGVNCGVGIAAEFLQRALNITNYNQQSYPDLTVDKRIGPRTLDTLNKHQRPEDVFFWLNILQGARYVSIMERAPAQEKFARSWKSRVSIVKA
jgi:lysozyme family protein